jgi:hypothetical protein
MPQASLGAIADAPTDALDQALEELRAKIRAQVERTGQRPKCTTVAVCSGPGVQTSVIGPVEELPPRSREHLNRLVRGIHERLRRMEADLITLARTRQIIKSPRIRERRSQRATSRAGAGARRSSSADDPGGGEPEAEPALGRRRTLWRRTRLYEVAAPAREAVRT